LLTDVAEDYSVDFTINVKDTAKYIGNLKGFSFMDAGKQFNLNRLLPKHHPLNVRIG
jgi:hypothetical protein